MDHGEDCGSKGILMRWTELKFPAGQWVGIDLSISFNV
jgi:hypothetical protein